MLLFNSSTLTKRTIKYSDATEDNTYRFTLKPQPRLTFEAVQRDSIFKALLLQNKVENKIYAVSYNTEQISNISQNEMPGDIYALLLKRTDEQRVDKRLQQGTRWLNHSCFSFIYVSHFPSMDPPVSTTI